MTDTVHIPLLAGRVSRWTAARLEYANGYVNVVCSRSDNVIAKYAYEDIDVHHELWDGSKVPSRISDRDRRAADDLNVSDNVAAAMSDELNDLHPLDILGALGMLRKYGFVVLDRNVFDMLEKQAWDTRRQDLADINAMASELL